jgi:predicted amidohydrolase YtcJ
MSGAIRVVGPVVIVVTALATLACNTTVQGQTASASAPEVVYYNGKIATVNAQFDMAQAVAVRQGRIVAVGANDAVRALASGATRLVDLQGKTVLPGFYDNHVHLSGGQAPDPNGVDLWEATSLPEALEGIRRKAQTLPKGEWIRAELPYTTGIPHPFPEKNAPTRADLDKVAPDHPVMVTRGAHLTIVNSLAMQKAKLTRNSKAPGGVIDKDARGEPTGKLREGPARKLISRVMTPLPRPDPQQAKAGMRRFLEALLAVGITSLNVAGIEITNPDQWRTLQDLYAEAGDKLPRLTVQLRISPGYDRFDDLKTAIETTTRELQALPFRTGFGDDRLKVGAIKMSIDGAFSGPTSWILPPFPKPDFEPSIRIPEESFYAIGKLAHDLGWQLGIHCIGDGAIQMCVNNIERIMKESPRPDPRHFIHHYTALPPESVLKKTADVGIIVASQPNWVFSKAQFAPDIVSGDRLQRVEPQKSLFDRGIRVSYGSDGMPHGPMVGIYGAVTRKSSDGTVLGADERVSLQQALRSYTMETAYMTFDEKNRGSLEVGKYADMVVLAEDIFTVPPDRIKDIGILKTIVGGQELVSTTTPAKPFQQMGHPWFTKPATP